MFKFGRGALKKEKENVLRSLSSVWGDRPQVEQIFKSLEVSLDKDGLKASEAEKLIEDAMEKIHGGGRAVSTEKLKETYLKHFKKWAEKVQNKEDKVMSGKLQQLEGEPEELNEEPPKEKEKKEPKKSKVRAVEREDGTIHIKRGGAGISLGAIKNPLCILNLVPWVPSSKEKSFVGVDIQFRRNERGGLTEVTIKYAERRFRKNLRDKDIRYFLEQAKQNGWSEISAEGFDAKTRKRIYEMAVKEYGLKINPSDEDKKNSFIQNLIQEGLKNFKSKKEESKDLEITADRNEGSTPTVNVATSTGPKK